MNERAESANADGVSEQPEADDGRIKAVQAQTNAEILKIRFVREFAPAVQHYFDVVGLGKFLSDVDFESVLEQAFSGLPEASVSALPEDIQAAPLHETPIFHQLLDAAADIFINRLIEKFQRGNLFEALLYIILSAECMRVTGRQFPPQLLEHYVLISKRVTKGGEFEQLFLKTQNLLDGIRIIHAESTENGRSEKKRAESSNYKQADMTQLSGYSIGILIRYAVQARAAGDFQSVVAIQRAVIAKRSQDVHARVILARSLEILGRLEEAIAVCGEIENLEGSHFIKGHLARLRQKIADRDAVTAPEAVDAPAPAAETATEPQNPLPIRYEHFKPEMLKGHPKGSIIYRLIGYSIQAQRKQDWPAVVVFQKEIVKRQPNDVRACKVLSIALEQVGDFRGALEAMEPLMKCLGYKQNPGDVRRLAELRGKATAQALDSLRAPAETASAAETETSNREAEIADGIATAVSAVDAAADAADARPEPARPSNIDYSRFDNFLNSLQRATASWETETAGQPWRLIPEADQDGLIQSIHHFEERMNRKKILESNPPFSKSFAGLKKAAAQGRTNLRMLATLIERMQGFTGVSWGEL